MDPKKFSVAQLKAELRRRDLPISGTKKDFIARLDGDDPSDEWINDILRIETSKTVPENTATDEDGAAETEDEEEDRQRIDETTGSRQVRGTESRTGSVRNDDPEIERLTRQYRDMQVILSSNDVKTSF